MLFEWDDAKNATNINIRKHGIDFADAIDIFNHPMLVYLDDRTYPGEEREVAIGWIHLLIGVVVYTERKTNVIRIISARKARRLEVRHYEQSTQN